MEKIRNSPYNLEAEQSLLACILIDQQVQVELLSLLKPDDFLVESHKIIMTAMKNVISANIPVDLVTLTDLLQKEAKMERVGGIEYLSTLTQTVPSSANYQQYFDIVKRDSILRKLISGSNQIITEASKSTDSSASLAFAQSVVFNISEGSTGKGLENLSESCQAVLDKIELLEKNKNFFEGLKTGYNKLNFLTNGLHKGNLVILAARPSIGKTTFAMNIVEHVALRENKIVAVFALEMTKEELAQRMMCSVAHVNMDAALKGELTEQHDDSLLKLWKAKAEIEKAKIFIDESSVVTPQDILSRCRKQKLTDGLDLVVVDHIQLMEPSRPDIENRQQQVTDISRKLKMIAKELQVPVIALSQLSRQIASRKGGRPVLSDLRESGAIEQDADVVMFIHRPDKDAIAEDAEKATPNLAEIIIAKNRNGMCGDFPLYFRGNEVRFVDPDKQELAEIERAAQKAAEEKKTKKTKSSGASEAAPEDVPFDNDAPPEDGGAVGGGDIIYGG